MSPPKGNRSSSHGRRVPSGHAKASKPAPLKKTTNVPSEKSAKSPTSLSGKNGSGWSKRIGKTEQTDTDDEDMAGLPHFCAMCEKQIITPGSTILYCSEGCRRRDSNKPLTHASTTIAESPVSPPRRSSYFETQALPDILPQRSPTMVRPPSITFSDTSEVSFFDVRASYNRSESEAARYLAQFSSPNASPERRRRPQCDRQAHSLSHSTLPSLSHTPGSLISPGTSFSSSRPLPSRTNPYSISFNSHSVDLITPLSGLPSLAAASSLGHENASRRSSASTSTAYKVAEGGMSYEKKKQFNLSDMSTGRGSLKELLGTGSIK